MWNIIQKVLMQVAVAEHVFSERVNYAKIGIFLRILKMEAEILQPVITFIGNFCEILHNLTWSC